jgi:hypothetical protein
MEDEVTHILRGHRQRQKKGGKESENVFHGREVTMTRTMPGLLRSEMMR